MYSIWAFALVALEADCGQFWMKHSAGKGVATELDFFVRFWGVRGSIPCPGEATSRYGGNTSCIEVRCGEHLLIFDAGTGFSELGKRLRGEGPLDADLFLTHTHYDHIWGWPHFYPGLEADTRLHIRADRAERRKILRYGDLQHTGLADVFECIGVSGAGAEGQCSEQGTQQGAVKFAHVELPMNERKLKRFAWLMQCIACAKFNEIRAFIVSGEWKQGLTGLNSWRS